MMWGQMSMNPALDEAKFWARTAFGMIGLAILAGTLLTGAKMDATQVASVVVAIMGFAGVMVAQLRIASLATTRANEVREAVVTQGDEVKDAIGGVDRRCGEIQATGQAVHTLVRNELGLVLRANAIATARLVALQDTEENRQAAARAGQALRDYERGAAAGAGRALHAFEDP